VFLLGNEVTGIVSEVGDNVKSFVKGDRVLSITSGAGFSTHCIGTEEVSVKKTFTAHAVTSIKQLPVLESHIFLSCHRKFHMN
jgi:NADPH:quinone reductase-like Zn-dependent oxidoreductase